MISGCSVNAAIGIAGKGDLKQFQVRRHVGSVLDQAPVATMLIHVGYSQIHQTGAAQV